MTLDIQIALALKAPDTFDKVHKNIVTITDDFAIGFQEWMHENCYYDTYSLYQMYGKDGRFDLKQLLEIYKKERGL